MPLAKMGDMLREARKKGRCIGSFSVAGLEMIQGVIRAAEKTEQPVMLQVAQVRLDTSPLSLIGPAMLAAAREAKVDVAVHLDHGMDMDCIAQALEMGFTSVMIDGSELPLEENIKLTREAVALSHRFGADVEGEIGRVGRTESGEDAPLVYANPKDALRFVDETGVDALAVGIGNSHGAYSKAPFLRFDILEQISAKMDTPLVLHGGTGLSKGDYQRAILGGIRKINIATACFQAAFNAARSPNIHSIFSLSALMIEATEQVVREHLGIFSLQAKEQKAV